MHKHRSLISLQQQQLTQSLLNQLHDIHVAIWGQRKQIRNTSLVSSYMANLLVAHLHTQLQH